MLSADIQSDLKIVLLLLLLGIERSQLVWASNQNASWAPSKGDLGADPEHAGGITYLIWSGKVLKSRKTWLGSRTSGLNLLPDKWQIINVHGQMLLCLCDNDFRNVNGGGKIKSYTALMSNANVFSLQQK